MPKVLYVKQEQDGDDEYLIASPDLEDHAAVGVKVRVGVYDLRHQTIVTTKVEAA